MKQIGLPLGKSDFESIRENALFYVDKTPLIEELLKKNGTEVFLFTRPRRFGKTLALSMLSSFFDISKDSTRLFEGLKISENSELCEERMNRSPTVFISFKSVDGLSYDDAFARLSTIMMGVPVTFLDKYNPDQFEIIWQASGNTRACAPKEILIELGYKPHPEDRGGCGIVYGKRVYSRILIRRKQQNK